MNTSTRSTRFLVAIAALLIAFLVARPASADTIPLVWDQNSEPDLAGYIVHVGTASGTYTEHYDVGLVTAWPFNNAIAGQRYCFSVSAYFDGPIESGRATEVCGYSRSPVLANPGPQTSTIGTASTLQLAGNDPSGSPVTYSVTGLPPGLSLMASTGFISGTPTTAGTYSVTVTVTNGRAGALQTFSWTVAAPDAGAPTIAIAGPTSAASYATTALTVTLSGTAADDMGVTQVTWVSSRGGSGTAAGAGSWSVAGVTLASGINVLTVTARDAAGNTSSDVLTVTVNTAPTLAVIATQSATVGSPTTVQLVGSDANGDALTYSATGLPAGLAVNAASGLISGTPSVANTYNVTATVSDATSTASRAFTWTVVAATDRTVPTITITTPTTSTTYDSPAASLTLGGTAGDNAAVTLVTWSTDRGASGTASGTTTWSAPVPLQPGDTVVTVTARDAAGNVATDVLRARYSVEPIQVVSLSPDRAAPQPPGTAITWTVVAAGGQAPYQYKWWVFDGANWVVAQTWNAASTFTWRPASASSTYQVKVAVQSTTNWESADKSAPYTIAANTDSTAPTVSIAMPTAAATWSTASSTATLSGNAQDNVGVTQVTWVNNRGGSGIATGTTNWSASVTLLAGDNVVTVTARDATGNVAQDVLTVSYSVGPIQVVSLTADRAAPQAPGTTITFTAVAAGGQGPYQYKWWVLDNGAWVVAQAWNASNRLAWRPTHSSSSYQVKVAAQSTTTWESADKTVTYVIQ